MDSTLVGLQSIDLTISTSFCRTSTITRTSGGRPLLREVRRYFDKSAIREVGRYFRKSTVREVGCYFGKSVVREVGRYFGKSAVREVARPMGLRNLAILRSTFQRSTFIKSVLKNLSTSDLKQIRRGPRRTSA